jgi:hypothetical protein
LRYAQLVRPLAALVDVDRDSGPRLFLLLSLELAKVVCLATVLLEQPLETLLDACIHRVGHLVDHLERA